MSQAPVITTPAPAAPSADSTRPRPFVRLRHNKILLLLAVLVLAVGGAMLWRYLTSYETTDDAQVDAHLYPVSARISGYVANVYVNDNQYVEKGTVLVEIDPRDYQVAVEKARADLESAEAVAQSLGVNVPIASVTTSSQLSSATSEVENAEAGIVVAERQLAAAEAQLSETKANDVKYQSDLHRYKGLAEEGVVSQQVYDDALAAATSSTAAIAAAEANLSAAQQAVRQAKSRLTEAQANQRTARTAPQQVQSTRSRAQSAIADVQFKRAALEQAELNLQYTKIVAPVNGEVTKTVVVGLNVQPGQELITIVPLEDVWITANFKETQMERMRPGQRVDIKVDSNGHTYKGHVDSISGATGPLFSVLPPENATGNYVKVVQRIPVKIVLEPGENRDRRLRPGMSVEPKVHLR